MLDKRVEVIKFIFVAYRYRKGWETFFAPFLKKYNLSHNEVKLIEFLYEEETYNSAKYISELTGMKKGIISIYIEKMIKKGWIIQEEDKDDRRKKRLFLTDKSKSVMGEIKKLQEELNKSLIEGIPKEDIEISDSVYERIYENIKKLSKKKIDLN